MEMLKSFFKWFAMGLLVLSVFIGGIVGIYYAATVHWALAIGSLIVFGAIGIGIAVMFIFEFDLG